MARRNAPPQGETPRDKNGELMIWFTRGSSGTSGGNTMYGSTGRWITKAKYRRILFFDYTRLFIVLAIVLGGAFMALYPDEASAFLLRIQAAGFLPADWTLTW